MKKLSPEGKINSAIFAEICKTAPSIVVVYSPDLEVLYANSKAINLVGMSASEVIGKKINEIDPDIEKTYRYKKYLDTIKTGTPHTFTFSKDFTSHSEPKWYEVHTDRISGNLVIIAHEVTELNRVLFKQTPFFKTLMENVPALVYIKDKNLRFTSVNRKFAEYYNLNPEDIIGKRIEEIIDTTYLPREREAEADEDRKVLEEDLVIENKERILFHSDSDPLWVLQQKFPLKDQNGETRGLMGIALDITSRKIIEAEINLLVTAAQQTSETIVITDLQGTIQYVNPAFERITGFTADEAIGQNPRVLKSGKHSEKFYKELWDTLTKGKTWKGHFINKKKDGTLYEEDATISPVKDKDGNIVNYVALKKDVTKEIEIAAQLRQSQKMEAIGRLAGGIAHDFNNILTIIIGYSELLSNTLTEENKAYKQIKEIYNAGKRASALTQQLLAFSKKQLIEIKAVKINNLINDFTSMMKSFAGENITFSVNLNSQHDTVSGDKNQIEQVLMNLVVNARDAIGEKHGNITIRTENITLQEPFSDGNFIASAGEYVEIIVEDTGCGIEEHILPHIFEPFFTAKKNKPGTGLGLATVYGIIKQHNGFMTVYSTPGEGSSFHVAFPKIQNEALNNTVDDMHSTAANSLSKQNISILVVEDEPAVREYINSIFNETGYKAKFTEDAETALELIENSEDSFDLIITDMILPNMSGDKLAEIVREKRPEIKILFMSGYSGEYLDNLHVELSTTNFISKPFSIKDFTQKISDILSETHTGER